MKTRLKELLKDPNVIEYIKLTNKIEKQNETWIYLGSYHILMDEYGFEYEYQIKDESEKNFRYNKYKNISTNEEVEIKDYKKFEEEHKVIKEYNKTYNEYITKYFKQSKKLTLTK